MSQRYVIDANVLFSAFISGKDLYQFLFKAVFLVCPIWLTSDMIMSFLKYLHPLENSSSTSTEFIFQNKFA